MLDKELHKLITKNCGFYYDFSYKKDIKKIEFI